MGYVDAIKIVAEKCDGWNITNLNKMVELLRAEGLDIREEEDEYGKHFMFYSPFGYKPQRVGGRTWDDDFQAMKYGNPMGFCLVVPAKETDEVEYRDIETDELYTDFDENGKKINKEISLYAVVKEQEQVPAMVGWLVDTPEKRAELSVLGSTMAYTMARIFANKCSDKMGRGFSFSENMQFARDGIKENANA
jgi:hypothetical protein